MMAHRPFTDTLKRERENARYTRETNAKIRAFIRKLDNEERRKVRAFEKAGEKGMIASTRLGMDHRA